MTKEELFKLYPVITSEQIDRNHYEQMIRYSVESRHPGDPDPCCKFPMYEEIDSWMEKDGLYKNGKYTKENKEFLHVGHFYRDPDNLLAEYNIYEDLDEIHGTKHSYEHQNLSHYQLKEAKKLKKIYLKFADKKSLTREDVTSDEKLMSFLSDLADTIVKDRAHELATTPVYKVVSKETGRYTFISLGERDKLYRMGNVKTDYGFDIGNFEVHENQPEFYTDKEFAKKYEARILCSVGDVREKIIDMITAPCGIEYDGTFFCGKYRPMGPMIWSTTSVKTKAWKPGMSFNSTCYFEDKESVYSIEAIAKKVIAGYPVKNVEDIPIKEFHAKEALNKAIPDDLNLRFIGEEDLKFSANISDCQLSYEVDDEEVGEESPVVTVKTDILNATDRDKFALGLLRDGESVVFSSTDGFERRLLAPSNMKPGEFRKGLYEAFSDSFKKAACGHSFEEYCEYVESYEEAVSIDDFLFEIGEERV